MLMTANEAASVTGVPLRQVHRIIDAGLLGGAVKRRRNARLLKRNALIGLKLAHETADVLTAEGRRIVVSKLIRRPRQASFAPMLSSSTPVLRPRLSGLGSIS